MSLAEQYVNTRKARKKKIQIKLFTWLGILVFRAIWLTLRFQKVNYINREKAETMNKSPVILAAWHQNTVLSMMGHGKQDFCVMISRSFDGDIIAGITESFHMKTARGSSSRGGANAYLEMVEHVKSGGGAAFTVDGPRGPLKKVKPGVIKLAQQTGAQILPMAALADRYWSLHKSWDKFRIPKPFSKVKLIYGTPIKVPPDVTDFTPYMDKLENILKELDREAGCQYI